MSPGPFSFLRRPWVRLLLGLSILALLFVVFPIEQFWDAIRRVSIGVWLAVLGLFIAGHAVGALKWGLLIQGEGRRLPYGQLFRFHFAGLFANLFLPSVAGGDLVRAGLAMRTASSREAVVVGSLLDRLLDTLTLVLFVLVGSAWARAGLSGLAGRLVLGVGGLILLGGLAGMAGLFLPLPGFVPGKLRDLRDRIRQAAMLLVRNPAPAVAAFSLSLLIQGTFVALNATLGRACGIDLPWTSWYFAWPLAKLSAMAPISLGGLGVREAALAVVLGPFGVPGAQAIGVGLLWQTILIATGGFGGIFYALARRSERRVAVTEGGGSA